MEEKDHETDFARCVNCNEMNEQCKSCDKYGLRKSDYEEMPCYFPVILTDKGLPKHL